MAFIARMILMCLGFLVCTVGVLLQPAYADGFDFSAPGGILTYSIDGEDIVVADGHRKARMFGIIEPGAGPPGGDRGIRLGLSIEKDVCCDEDKEDKVCCYRYVRVRHPKQPLAVYVGGAPTERIKANTLLCRVIPHGTDVNVHKAKVWIGATNDLTKVTAPEDTMQSTEHWHKCFEISVCQPFERITTGAAKGGLYVLIGISTGSCYVDVAGIDWTGASETVDGGEATQVIHCQPADTR